MYHAEFWQNQFAVDGDPGAHQMQSTISSKFLRLCILNLGLSYITSDRHHQLTTTNCGQQLLRLLGHRASS